MSELMGKIDFTLFVEVRNANPNGDPLTGNRPRTTTDGFGEISDVCIKRKIRNRWQDMGQRIFVQSNDRVDDGCYSLKARAEMCKDLKKELDKKTGADLDLCASIACREWIDVRGFGQVLALKAPKGDDESKKASGVSLGVRGPISIHPAFSLSPISITSIQITKSTNNEGDNSKKSSDTMGLKHRIDYAVYRIVGCVNVQLAKKTGFSQEDAECLKEALKTLFDNDASSARPEGSMTVRKMYWWQHNDTMPIASSAKIQDAFVITATKNPKRFSDYSISWSLDDCVEPEIFEP